MYAIFIKNTEKEAEEIAFCKSIGYEYVQLPDKQALMVAGDAPEEIKDAAFAASGGDFDALKIAIGIGSLDDETA